MVPHVGERGFRAACWRGVSSDQAGPAAEIGHAEGQPRAGRQQVRRAAARQQHRAGRQGGARHRRVALRAGPGFRRDLQEGAIALVDEADPPLRRPLREG